MYMKDLKRIADALESIAHNLTLMREDQEKNMELAKLAMQRGEENAGRLMSQFSSLLIGNKSGREDL